MLFPFVSHRIISRGYLSKLFNQIILVLANVCVETSTLNTSPCNDIHLSKITP